MLVNFFLQLLYHAHTICVHITGQARALSYRGWHTILCFKALNTSIYLYSKLSYISLYIAFAFVALFLGKLQVLDGRLHCFDSTLPIAGSHI